jgi:hypothetical protein
MNKFILDIKKYTIGILIGVALTIGVSAHAEVASMIGKVVEGSFPMIINGAKAEKDGLVIDGTTYIPARNAGQMFGYDVSFVDSQVIMNAKDGVVNLDKLKQEQDKQAILDKQAKDLADNLAQIKSEQDALDAAHQKALADEVINQEKRKKIMEDDAKKQQQAPTSTPTP